MSSRNDVATTITAETLLDLPVPDHPRLSSDGKQVIYQTAPCTRKGEHSKTQLWLADTATEDSAHPFTSGLYNDHSPEWSPDASTKLVSFISDRSEAGKSCAIYCTRTDGGEAYPVTDVKAEKGISTYAWSPNGVFIAYVSADEDSKEIKDKKEKKNDVKVYGERWEYGRLRLLHVNSRDVSTVFAEDEHITDFSWSPDGKQLIFATSKTPLFNSLITGSCFHVYDLPSKRLVFSMDWEGAVWSINWAKTGIWVRSGVSPASICTSNAVYGLSLEKKECRHKAYGDGSCVSSVRSYGDAVFIHELAGMMDNIILKGSRFLQHDKGIGAWDARLVGDTPIVAFCSSDVSSPKELYFHSTSGIRKLSTHGKKIADLNYATYHDLKTKSYDGTTKLEGYFISPTSASASKPLPTLVSIHGGPYWRLSQTFDPTHFQYGPPLTASGKYGVLLPNYRGGSGYGEAFAAHAKGAMGTVEYDDVIALVEEGIKKGLVDKNRIIVSGWSQGGFLSYVSAVRNAPGQSPRKIPDWRFAGAICGAGVVDWDLMTMTSDVPAFEGELAGGSPWDADKSDVKSRLGSAIWELRNGAKDVPPMLLVHGEADERVPVTNAIAFHRGCLQYKIPCDLAIYPREPHDMKEREHVLDLIHRIGRFVDLHIGS